jgi:hypothetical protein
VTVVTVKAEERQMPSFDPLTAADLAILAELTAAPIEISTNDMLFSERGKALTYLCQLDFARQEVTHISRTAGSSINTITATGKAVPNS